MREKFVTTMKYVKAEAEAEAETHVVDYSAFSHPLGLDGVKRGFFSNQPPGSVQTPARSFDFERIAFNPLCRTAQSLKYLDTLHSTILLFAFWNFS